ncbi:MAG TPA: mechanosensitive ion channel family protein [Woeseiaceae bacterium]|jgi:small-conductance mechanosensitive channel|nr:mechanosensitive ion channel family protein [Woeseiaceae bacterium]
MDEFTAQVQRLAELIGPNVFLQAAIIAAVFILMGKIADWVISGVAGRVAQRSTNDFDDRLVDLVHRPVFLSFVLLGLGLATLRVSLPESPTFVTLGLLKTIAIFVWINALGQLNRLAVEALQKSATNKLVQSGMLPLLHNVLKVLLAALAIYFVFLAWDIDVTAWLASAGIVGLALSFAAKDTLANLFAGVSIVMDAPFKTGDYIILDSGERGIVTEIGLRSTRILTRDDVEITVPNGIIGNSTIINEAGGPPSRHRIRVAVGAAYGSDVDHVLETLEDVARNITEILDNPEPRARFRRFGESSLEFELMGWIARPADRGRVQHELNCAVYKSFMAENIEIPYPQRDVHVRTMPPDDD